MCSESEASVSESRLLPFGGVEGGVSNLSSGDAGALVFRTLRSDTTVGIRERATSSNRSITSLSGKSSEEVCCEVVVAFGSLFERNHCVIED